MIKLGLGVCTLLSNELMAALSSFTSCSLSLLQIDSTTVIQSVLGMLEEANAKFRPLVKRDSCALVRPCFRQVYDPFTAIAIEIACLLLTEPCIWLLGPNPLLWLLPIDLIPLFLLIVLLTKELSFPTCLSMTLVNISSLIFLMNLLHLSLSVMLVTLDTSSDLHLFMAFILSFSVAFIT